MKKNIAKSPRTQTVRNDLSSASHPWPHNNFSTKPTHQLIENKPADIVQMHNATSQANFSIFPLSVDAKRNEE